MNGKLTGFQYFSYLCAENRTFMLDEMNIFTITFEHFVNICLYVLNIKKLKID